MHCRRYERQRSRSARPHALVRCRRENAQAGRGTPTIRGLGRPRKAWTSASRPGRVVTASECGCRTGTYARSVPRCSPGAADSAIERPAGCQEPGSFPEVPAPVAVGRGLAREMDRAGPAGDPDRPSVRGRNRTARQRPQPDAARADGHGPARQPETYLTSVPDPPGYRSHSSADERALRIGLSIHSSARRQRWRQSSIYPCR